jgi:hypothetical protein
VRAADFLLRAEQADAQAEKALDSALKQACREVGQRWRELARQVEKYGDKPEV